MAETKRTEGGFAFTEDAETELIVGLGKFSGVEVNVLGGGIPSDRALANS